MDKDILRIVIITLGVLIMLGMVAWSYFNNRQQRRNSDPYDRKNPLGNIDDSLVVKTENNEFDIVPVDTGFANEFDSAEIDPIFNNPAEPFEAQENIGMEERFSSEVVEPPKVNVQENINPGMEEQLQSELSGTIANDFGIDDFNEVETKQIEPEQNTNSNVVVPSIIQIHVFALDYDGFKGKDLIAVFKEEKLEYGNLKIYERYDDQRRVDFAVASMVEPGTFPEKGMETFSCPGIVFFLQPSELDKPLKIFDEFIATIDRIAEKLEGVKLDKKRDPLSTDAISQLRRGLSN